MIRNRSIKIAVIGTAVAALLFLMVPTAKVSAHSGAVSIGASRALYNTHCASCHGGDGRSNTKRGRETEADDISGGISTSKTVRVVTNGKGDMPSFKRKLTAAQIASIARYVAKL